MRFLKAARYSTVGVMLAGVFSAIAGCSTEDSIRAIILFIIMFLMGGGGAEETTTGGGGTPPVAVCVSGATAACAIDLYTDAASQTDLCDGNNTPVDTDPAPGAIGNNRRLSDFAFSNASTASITIQDGVIRYKNTTATVCFAGQPGYPAIGFFPVDVDLSNFSKIEYTVTHITGVPPSNCKILFEESNAAPTTDNIFVTVPADVAGPHTVNLPATDDQGDPADFDHIRKIFSWTDCVAFPANAEWTISPFVLVP